MSPSVLRWLCLVAVIWLQSINGTNLSFPAYSSQLKQSLSISQIKLNYLAFASDAGKLLGFISGIAAVPLPLRLVLIAGGSLGFAGYGLQYLIIVKKMFSPSFPAIWVLSFLAGNSICWINTTCYTVAINNFPANRQVAVGITASYQGLSGKIYTDIVNAFFSASPSDSTAGYLVLNALVPLIVCGVTAFVIADAELGASSDAKIGFVVMFIVTTATGVYAVVTSLVPAPEILVLTGIVLLLLAPLAIPLGFQLEEIMFTRKNHQKVHDEEFSPRSVRVRVGEETVKGEGEEAFCNAVGVKEEIKWTELWKKIDFWIYFSVYLCGPTVGLVFLNNLGQIAESRGCTATASLVALSSSSGFFGRLLPSLLEYFFSRSKHMPSSPASMAVSLAFMASAFFVLLVESDMALYASTAAIGVSTGVVTSLAVTTTAELFGTKNFGVNHNIVVANIPLGSFAFGWLAANVYREGASGGSDGECEGMHCFETTLFVWALLCSLAAVLAAVLHGRNRRFYSLDKS
ncbi:PREDICTED: protein NUCLEAR FUSION DEFECTIVE 4-like [Tarenaya hassleriana]|uniref:protein NUCLEAR FUSION DEFECTIVE 4-like n=1 Tax=Tarenaya hassleriana TaxID=28532 RepID=UPI00053C27A8|nr:PREDICTED: protein NUCLEAR FUSION DEFECTIVE 4-like [Tarenaya hassleriana]